MPSESSRLSRSYRGAMASNISPEPPRGSELEDGPASAKSFILDLWGSIRGSTGSAADGGRRIELRSLTVKNGCAPNHGPTGQTEETPAAGSDAAPRSHSSASSKNGASTKPALAGSQMNSLWAVT